MVLNTVDLLRVVHKKVRAFDQSLEMFSNNSGRSSIRSFVATMSDP